MTDLSGLLENEKINWPPELKPIRLLKGTNQMGDCWKVEFNTQNLINQLQTELNKRKRQLRLFENRYEELNISDNYETDDMRIYDGDGEMSQLDVLITKTRNRIAQIEVELENLTQKYDIKQLETNGINNNSNTKNKNRSKKKTKQDENQKEDENLTDICCYAKLLLNPFIIRNNKNINKKHITTTLDEELNSLVNELNSVKECLNSYNSDTPRDEEGKKQYYYMNMILIDKIMRSTNPFNDTYSVMYLTSWANNGSVTDYLESLPNRDNIYQIDDNLLYENLVQHIKLLSHLEKFNLSHNNIKPNNVLISNDGSKLLLTDFSPISLFVERCYKIYTRKLTTKHKFMSPELNILLTNEIAFYNMDMSKILSNKINKEVYNLDFTDKIKTFVCKNDMFCLGLVYYYLLTLKIPEQDEMYYDEIINELNKIMKSRKKELVDLVIRMLEYDSFTRDSWNDLCELIQDGE